MKRLKLPRLSGRKQLLAWMGILLLLAAGVFGIMKFLDVFGQNNDNDSAFQSDGQDEPAEQQEEIKDDPEPKETPADEAPIQPVTPKPNTAQSGPTEGVGTLSWVVNKRRPLNPLQYVPPNLVNPSVKNRAGNLIRGDVAPAVQQLFAAAQAAGHDPMFSSGYRSYSTQSSLYNNYVASDGQAAADTYSARPGHSEHQTGLAFDICIATACSLEESFANTGLGQWVAAHAHEYGFIIRYPNGKQHITGFTYEPWHLRYVGKDLALQIKSSGQTLEEHFGLPAAPDYN